MAYELKNEEREITEPREKMPRHFIKEIMGLGNFSLIAWVLLNVGIEGYNGKIRDVAAGSWEDSPKNPNDKEIKILVDKKWIPLPEIDEGLTGWKQGR